MQQERSPETKTKGRYVFLKKARRNEKRAVYNLTVLFLSEVVSVEQNVSTIPVRPTVPASPFPRHICVTAAIKYTCIQQRDYCRLKESK